MFLLGFRRKLTALALCKSIKSVIQWFQIHHRITFTTIPNPAVFLSGARVSIFSTLVPRLNILINICCYILKRIKSVMTITYLSIVFASLNNLIAFVQLKHEIYRDLLTSRPLLVMFAVFLLLSHVVSWVRCGTWLYRFLIFASFLTL